MTKPNLLLIGAGGHAKSCIDVIEMQTDFVIGALIGKASEINTDVLGYPVIGADEDLGRFVRDYPYALICVGHIKSAERRYQLYNLAVKCGFRLPVIISPLAHVSSHAKISEGTIVMHQVIVNSGAVIGKNCIINTKSLIEHDARVGDHCHISTGAILNGGTTVGNNSFIGSASIIKNGKSIGRMCTIGMGSIIKKNILDGEIFVD